MDVKTGDARTGPPKSITSGMAACAAIAHAPSEALSAEPSTGVELSVGVEPSTEPSAGRGPSKVDDESCPASVSPPSASEKSPAREGEAEHAARLATASPKNTVAATATRPTSHGRIEGFLIILV